MKEATGRRLTYTRIRMGLRRAEVAQMLGVRAGTIARWERFEAETIRTRHANGRLLALFATFAKWYAPLSMGAELRSALGSDDSGLSALQVLFDRFQAPRKTD